MTTWDAGAEIARLQGPILILGASGFVGANLMNRIRAVRKDVTGTAVAGVASGWSASRTGACDRPADANLTTGYEIINVEDVVFKAPDSSPDER